MARSTFTNHGITTLEGLKNWILTELGYPLITVELTDDQIDQAINNAFEIYTKYADFGEKYLALCLADYDQTNDYFDLSAYNIAAVYGMDTQGNSFLGGGDTIFSISNAMLQSGSYPFFGNGGMGGGWVTYQLAHEFTALANRMSGSGYSYDYDVYNKTLKLYPKPVSTATDYIIITCEMIPSDEQLFGNEYLKRFALAYSKIMLGTVRKKFGDIPLLGGATVNTEIGDDGKEELATLIENVRKDESMGNGFYIA